MGLFGLVYLITLSTRIVGLFDASVLVGLLARLMYYLYNVIM